MKITSNNIAAVSIAGVFGASFFVYSPIYLIVFVCAAYSSIYPSNRLPKMHAVIWPIVATFLGAALSSAMLMKLQHVPSIFLWCAVSIICSLLFLNLNLDVIWIAILIFNFAFIWFEIYALGLYASHSEVTASALVEILQSPVMIVPNDFAYFAMFLPLFSLASSKRFEKTGMVVLMTVNYGLFLTVSIILESRLALIAIAGLALSEILGKLNKNYGLWATVGFFLAFFFAFMLLFGKGMFSFETRMTLWFAAMHGILDSPWIGHGFGSFGQYYDQLRLFESEVLPSMLSIDQRHIPWPHNIILEIMFFYGVAGILPVVMFIKRLLNLVNGNLKANDPFVQLILIFSLLALFEMSLLRIQTVPIILIVWLSLNYQTRSEFRNY